MQINDTNLKPHLCSSVLLIDDLISILKGLKDDSFSHVELSFADSVLPESLTESFNRDESKIYHPAYFQLKAVSYPNEYSSSDSLVKNISPKELSIALLSENAIFLLLAMYENYGKNDLKDFRTEDVYAANMQLSDAIAAANELQDAGLIFNESSADDAEFYLLFSGVQYVECFLLDK